MPAYRVRYKAIYEGFTAVEAESAEEAVELVVDGEFQPGHQERVDWAPIGNAVLVEEA